ncbi:GSCOCG00003105001-RA-CDS [Cotesia congregata]|nr:GSCOCG00003105001-RA-CDS [Cotesia congregata]
MNLNESSNKEAGEVEIELEESNGTDNVMSDEKNCKAKIQNGILPNGTSSKMETDNETIPYKYTSTNPPLSINSNSNLQSNLSVCMNGCQSVAMTTENLPSPSLVSGSGSNDGTPEDPDMINNVDYNSGINKCPPKVSCNLNNELGATWSSSLNNIASIGSTSQGTCCVLRPNINGSRETAGPSGLSRREQNDRRDSSSENEGDDFSDDEDYCIYTYKGNDEAEVDERHRNGLAENQEAAGQQLSGRSSPEMDFLEMDFDPGPSCEQVNFYSDLASINEDIQNIALDNAEADSVFLNDLSGGKVQRPESLPQAQNEQNVSVELEIQDSVSLDGPSTSGLNHNPVAQCLPSTSSGIRKVGASLYNHGGIPTRESHGYHNTSGDLISPGDNRDADSELWADAAAIPLPENSTVNGLKVNLSSTLWHRMMAKKLMLHKQTAFNQSGESNLENDLCNDKLDDLQPVERVMLWSEQEAAAKQVTQIGTSACGATSAINALLALDVPFSPEVLVKSVATRLREPGTPLPRYLLSRSRAGATHKDVIRGISLASSGAVITKFFAFYPERAISLSHWLHYWISRGAVPIATLNLQNCSKESKIPDAWHHQMIFGVSQAGIYFTNPLECLPEQLVWHQLVSPSVLLVRRDDVLAHWNSSTDMTPLINMDHRWRRLNVLGQVVNIIRESLGQRPQPTTGTFSATHIRIPASYQSGITLVMRSDAAAAEELLQAEELPLL